jgi:hypothetical protein
LGESTERQGERKKSGEQANSGFDGQTFCVYATAPWCRGVFFAPPAAPGREVGSKARQSKGVQVWGVHLFLNALGSVGTGHTPVGLWGWVSGSHEAARKRQPRTPP